MTGSAGPVPRPESTADGAQILTDDGPVSVPETLRRDADNVAGSERFLPDEWPVHAVARAHGGIIGYSALEDGSLVVAIWQGDRGDSDGQWYAGVEFASEARREGLVDQLAEVNHVAYLDATLRPDHTDDPDVPE